MIVPVYQPLGSSSHILAQQLGRLHNLKATHTGTLDPMAEGVLVCLTGEDRYRKSEFNHAKEYTFQILVGCSTDSQDLLGLVTTHDFSKKIDANQLSSHLKAYIGTTKQIIPNFSAKRVAGQSYFDQAKQQKDLPKFTQTVNITRLSLEGDKTVSKGSLHADIHHKIKAVSGDFRQKEILKKWGQILSSTHAEEFKILTLSAVTSKRTYIRGIVRDISSELNIPMTTYHIIRTKNGPYQIQNCICLI